MNSELVIQLQDKQGNFICEKFSNLLSPKSIYIAICFTDNQQSEDSAVELKDKLIKAISNNNAGFKKISADCGGNAVSFPNCYAVGIADNIKLLIVVSDGKTNAFVNTDVLNWSEKILPVLPKGTNVGLPPPLSDPQAAFWTSDIDEVIPYIFGKIGVSDEDQRIFISYRRIDTTALAEQLFNRLNQERFEVFLDTFSINPGVVFQSRLYQELVDKAMVVFLESKNFSNSEWTQAEAAFVKLNRLGYIALNIDNAPKIPSVDEQFRIMISAADLTLEKELLIPKLDSVVKKIREQHSAALNYMKDYLNMSIVVALNNRGITPQYDTKGFIGDTAAKYKIWTTPRPPKLDDYHYAETSGAAKRRIIFGPRFMEDKRKILNEWLSNKSAIEFYNEGDILNLINSL